MIGLGTGERVGELEQWQNNSLQKKDGQKNSHTPHLRISDSIVSGNDFQLRKGLIELDIYSKIFTKPSHESFIIKYLF